MLYNNFLLALLFAALALSVYVLWPFMNVVIMAALLAALSQGLRRRFLILLNGRETLAALAVSAVVLFLIVLPVSLFLGMVALKVLEFVSVGARWLTEENIVALLADPRLAGLTDWLSRHVDLAAVQRGAREQVLSVSGNVGQWALKGGALFFSGLFEAVSQFFIMLFVLFYFVRDGGRLLNGLRDLAPLRSDQEDRILHRIRDVARAIIYGGFLTGLIQGSAAGLGMWISGISPFFWGTLTFMASFIPSVGTALIWIPLDIYLFASGQTGYGIFFAIWCIVVVGSIDNLLRPFLMEGGVKLPPFLIFLAILGGIAAFGVKGLVYGPLILSFATVMLSLYHDEFRDTLHEVEQGGQLLLGPDGMPAQTVHQPEEEKKPSSS